MVRLGVHREVSFQHDGAPGHCTNVVSEYLDETFGNRWIGRGDPITWPLEDVSSIRNLRTRRAVVTKDPPNMAIIYHHFQLTDLVR
ncbi:hypothetical protein B7P43_G15502 [Cryptotermes secundus]|uniref:Tc1-like transposase DDE domain-containing protein n=1 Tax=Cryptotermes secundus TaxID=105785 RepID=A0A2J7PIS4_9NEOP|nr:hypothetical protein B7P43_G15502 [Cryptotermes secundus]